MVTAAMPRASYDIVILSRSAMAILLLLHTINKIADFVKKFLIYEVEHVHLHALLMDMPISLIFLRALTLAHSY